MQRDLENKSSPAGLIWLLGIACGALIANVYFGQPLSGIISQAIGLSKERAGLIVTFPLMGYGLGLLFIVPAGDMLENRRLILALVAFEATSVLLLSFMGTPLVFLLMAFLAGLMASAVQILLPFVTYIVPVEQRGQAVGKVVSGVMLGIMLARPLSSFVTDMFTWKMIYRISGGLMLLLWFALRYYLPIRRPAAGLNYGSLLVSMWRIFTSTEILRRRAFYQGCLFGCFSIFWTAVPIYLTGPAFGLTQKQMALFALAGVAGAIAPPIAGRVADRGHSKIGTLVAMVIAICAFLVSYIAGKSNAGLGLMTASAIILDFAVSANLVFSQRQIYALGDAERSRLNGLFMALFFIGGSIGSAAGGWAYASYGWAGVAIAGCILPMMAILFHGTEKRDTKLNNILSA